MHPHPNPDAKGDNFVSAPAGEGACMNHFTAFDLPTAFSIDIAALSARYRGLHHLGVTNHGGGGIHVGGRPNRPRDRFKRHAFAMEGAINRQKMVHGSPA